jgi:hypothetical protein
VGDLGSTLEAVVIVVNRELKDDLKKLGRQMQETCVLGIDLLAEELHKLFFNWAILGDWAVSTGTFVAACLLD